MKMKRLTAYAFLSIWLFMAASSTGSSDSVPEVMANSSKECAICHIRWIQAFDRTEIQKERMQDVLMQKAGSGDMCLSCHDGSVADSRFKIWSTQHHTTNSVPSGTVKIPTEIFPLDDKGRMTCATCHTAHAVPDSSDLKTVIFLRRPNEDSSLCLYCHSGHAQKNEFQHPLGRIDFSIPQEILEAGGKTSEDGQTLICQTCHEPHGARNAWMLVLPPSKLCIACHSDKNPETDPPAGAPVHRIGTAYPGFEPPDTLLEQRAVFGSNGELSCLSCHRLHDASGAKPLLIRKNESSSLCLDCHKNEKGVLHSPHDLRISSPETVNAAGQTALESGPCGACHRVHGWARNVSETNRPHSSGCMECHQLGGPGSHNRPYIESHTVGTPVPDDMPVVLPLDKNTNTIGCLTCHNPHSPFSAEVSTETDDLIADSNDLQKQLSSQMTISHDRSDSKIQTPRSFLRYKGSELCVLCHDKLTDLPDQPHNPATFDSEERETLGLHSSIGPCRVCHTTHNAQGPHLWAHAPATPDGQPSDLCASCHPDKTDIQNSMHDPETSEWAQKLGFNSKNGCFDCHLIHDPNEQGGIWAYLNNTDISQTCEACHQDEGPGRKMETAHVGKTITNKLVNPPKNMQTTPDGRITCTTCHDIHQKDNDTKLLVAPRNELCGTCHDKRMGIQNSVHDTETADWTNQLDFVSKGSCIDCHPPHGPKNEGGIWAAIRKDQTAPAQSCKTCHWIGGPGKAKETAHFGLTLTNDPNTLPESMVVDSNMQILCLTCHDIHQKQQRPKLLIASRQDSDLCLTCHPKADSIIGTAHDLRTSAPDALNCNNEKADESGPCGSCHVVHSVSGNAEFWAQGPVSRKNLPNSYCISCHRQGRSAAAVPKYTEHPDVLLVNKIPPDQSGYSAFDKHEKLSQTGAISCLTCHEHHPASSASGTSWQSSVFLKPTTNKELCSNCHGAETLWRFLYYHKENRNPKTNGNDSQTFQKQ